MKLQQSSNEVPACAYSPKQVECGYSMMCQTAVRVDVLFYGRFRAHCSRWRITTSISAMAEFRTLTVRGANVSARQ
jgi:hypothetical protein